MLGVSILGSTGTIGVNTLDVIARNRDRFRVVGLTANTDVDGLAGQCRDWSPEVAVMADVAAAEELRLRLARLGAATQVLAGAEGLAELASSPRTDYVMAGIVGAAGLLPTLAAARAGKRVLLANKESLVMSGRLLVDAAAENGAELLPIDSEHNAIFQCMPVGFAGGLAQAGVRRILLTGSGGPFRTRPLEQLAQVTPGEACNHPNWVMGRKISVDSATMMNKGLEVIEACYLFDTGADRVQVLIHPESIIHSMVEYADGSVLSQMGNPDMRTPIAHALCWPERMDSGVKSLDMVAIGQLSFESPDFSRFPCLRLGYEAAEMGGTAAAILNAANEVAVAAFLDGRIRFTDIPVVVESALSENTSRPVVDLDTVLEDDATARKYAVGHVERLARAGH